ncbi:MAG: sulfatase [Opitutus sp.]|nr:sulfatase [Opitutus sp.]
MTARPDILWILTTQWRAQSCGYLGDPNARTPHLDGLAAQSINYTQAVTPHPFGPFARAALLTGVPSPANGIRDYFDALPAESRTIAHALRERGYTTAFFGKWHLGPRDPQANLVGEAHARMILPAEGRGGFEFWEGFESGFLLNDPWLHGTRSMEPMKFTGYQSDVLGERAVAWQREQVVGAGEVPWFVVVSLEAPHPPYDAPAGGVEPRAPDAIVLPSNVPRGGAGEARARKELAGYHAHIEATDRAIGRLVAAIDREQAAHGRGSPLVMVTSVHGDMHGAHGLFRKGWPYEESIRVPLLVRPPGPARETGDLVSAAGHRNDAAISLVDLPALTLAWADGIGMDVERREAAVSMPSVVALPHQCDRVWRGVRTKTRKLVLKGDGSTWLFFDLEQDPGEMNNLAGAPARAAEIDALRPLAGSAG